jgi:hypothetical protein
MQPPVPAPAPPPAPIPIKRIRPATPPPAYHPSRNLPVRPLATPFASSTAPYTTTTVPHASRPPSKGTQAPPGPMMKRRRKTILMTVGATPIPPTSSKRTPVISLEKVGT